MLLGLALPFGACAESLRIGVWAKGDAERAAAHWAPTVEHLNRALPQHQFTLLAVSCEDLLGGLKRGDLDFAILEPGLWLQLGELDNATVLATALSRFQKTRYAGSAGAILVAADRVDLRSPRDLRGQRLVSSDRRALRDWISVERELNQVGLHPSRDCREVAFVGDAEAAVAELVGGRADAAAVRAGTLDRRAAEGHPWRNVVTRAISGGDDPEVDHRVLHLEPGDRLLICSDGLHGVLGEARVADLLGAGGDDLQALCDRLVAEANAAGGPDNITLIAVAFHAA